MLLSLLLFISAYAGDCDSEYRKAVDEGPIDAEEVLYRMKCVEKTPSEEKSYICAIGGIPKRDERRSFGSLPLAALLSPSDQYGEITGFWRPHKARYRGEKNESIDINVSGNNYGVKVIRKKRGWTEKIQLSSLDSSLSYEKAKEGRAPERREFSCGEFVANEPELEPEKPKKRWGKGPQGIAVPGQATPGKRGSGPSKSGISGSY
jgi:hypothetical protein